MLLFFQGIDDGSMLAKQNQREKLAVKALVQVLVRYQFVVFEQMVHKQCHLVNQLSIILFSSVLKCDWF